jgi:hypothetical protein
MRFVQGQLSSHHKFSGANVSLCIADAKEVHAGREVGGMQVIGVGFVLINQTSLNIVD